MAFPDAYLIKQHAGNVDISFRHSITRRLCHPYIKYQRFALSPVLDDEGEQVGHRLGPHLSERVVVVALVEPHHSLGVCRGEREEGAVHARRRYRLGACNQTTVRVSCVIFPS